MKTTSRKITLFSLAALMTASLPVLPAGAVPSADAFCTRAQTLMTSREATLTAQLETMQTNFQDRLSRLASAQQTTDGSVEAARTTAKEQFEAKVAELLAIENLTEEQKQAIETFKTSVQAAETTRAAAVDAARETYRTDLQTTIEEQQATLTQAATIYQDAIKTAFTTASANCANGTAMANLQTAIVAARKALSDTRAGLQTGDDIKALAETRRSAVAAANTTFRDAVKQYSQDLAAALPQN